MLGQKITIHLHTSKHWELYSKFINELEEYEAEESRKREEEFQRMVAEGRMPKVAGILGGTEYGLNPLIPQDVVRAQRDQGE